VKEQTRPKEPLAKKAIYTAGYEGESITAFLQKLVAAGVERILDVRSNPVSRKPGFSKKTFSQLSETQGIEYVHLPALGVPASKRKNLRTFQDYQTLLRYYEQHILPSAEDARSEASRLSTERPSALVCFEADSQRCHRARLAHAISNDTGMEVIHL